jgi:cytochrome c biogenesis protein CcdA
LLALVPPPSGYIGLAVFCGGFNAPSAAQGALTLAVVGLGLTLPVWLAILKPTWQAAWQQRLMGSKTLHRWQLAYQFAGAALLTAVGLAFVFVQGFHRPLLELVR